MTPFKVKPRHPICFMTTNMRNYSMDADYDIFEIVLVIQDDWLFDAESYQRSYCTSHGQPLAPGYYVVNWPDHVRLRRFNEQAAFHGPFPSHKAAQGARDWMHHERERILTLSSEEYCVFAPDFSRIIDKEAA
jgi:hypothetical protein